MVMIMSCGANLNSLAQQFAYERGESTDEEQVIHHLSTDERITEEVLGAAAYNTQRLTQKHI